MIKKQQQEEQEGLRVVNLDQTTWEELVAIIFF